MASVEERLPIWKRCLFIVAFLYTLGAIYGGINLLFKLPFRPTLPNWEWWQYLLAPLGIGVIAVVFEGLFDLVLRPFGINQPGTPKWRQSLGVLVLLLLMALMIIGSAFYQIAHG
jgi:hypothetical protein